ncbi:hypothetical protein L345_14001, partial [Ophiophagus hannah]
MACWRRFVAGMSKEEKRWRGPTAVTHKSCPEVFEYTSEQLMSKADRCYSKFKLKIHSSQKRANASRKLWFYYPTLEFQARSRREKKNYKVTFSHEELRKRLTPLQYHVTQEKGTERKYCVIKQLLYSDKSAFEGEFTYNKAHGIYKCVVCGSPLFSKKKITNLKRSLTPIQ